MVDKISAPHSNHFKILIFQKNGGGEKFLSNPLNRLGIQRFIVEKLKFALWGESHLSDIAARKFLHKAFGRFKF
jgi:hypothetical protein